MFTKFGVYSLNHYSSRAWTTQSHWCHWTPCPHIGYCRHG